MKQLHDTIEDRQLLQTLLSNGSQPKAKFAIGVFKTEYAGSLMEKNYDGIVTAIDMKSGYCRWETSEGEKMPIVNLSIITLI